MTPPLNNPVYGSLGCRLYKPSKNNPEGEGPAAVVEGGGADRREHPMTPPPPRPPVVWVMSHPAGQDDAGEANVVIEDVSPNNDSGSW